MSQADASVELSAHKLADGLATAVGQMRFVREGTTTPMLEGLTDEDWLAMPAGPTNIAWQVAHIAVAQYGLCLFRIRGRAEADTELMPGPFRKMYGRGSVPSSDPAANAPIAVIRRTFDAVYEQAMKELPATDPATLAEPMDRPYAVYPNRLGCLLMAPVHEAIHAGQLGLIRRALGRDPLR